MSKLGLGKGIGSLLPDNFEIDSVTGVEERIKNVFINEVHANPDQPRKEFSEQGINELAESIRQYGIIQPLVVIADTGGYRIVAGERRYRAAKKLGLEKLPVIIRTHKQLEEFEIALVENVQRVDLSPLEQANSIMKLHSQFSMEFKDIAKKLGKAETTISNIVRLLQLPKEAMLALEKHQITEGHARAILSVKNDPDRQKSLLKEIVSKGLSVRQAEAFASEQKQKSNPISRTKAVRSLKYDNLLKLKATKLGANKIDHQMTAKGNGKLQIYFDSPEQLEKIISNL